MSFLAPVPPTTVAVTTAGIPGFPEPTVPEGKYNWYL